MTVGSCGGFVSARQQKGLSQTSSAASSAGAARFVDAESLMLWQLERELADSSDTQDVLDAGLHNLQAVTLIMPCVTSSFYVLVQSVMIE